MHAWIEGSWSREITLVFFPLIHSPKMHMLQDHCYYTVLDIQWRQWLGVHYVYLNHEKRLYEEAAIAHHTCIQINKNRHQCIQNNATLLPLDINQSDENDEKSNEDLLIINQMHLNCHPTSPLVDCSHWHNLEDFPKSLSLHSTQNLQCSASFAAFTHRAMVWEARLMGFVI